MKKKHQDIVLIFIILITGALLRFYKLHSIPFTHDEFSALFRLRFDTFKELIEYGVAIDGHPAGVQVFLFYYTRFFSAQEWVVKLPFLLMGLGSVYLVFKMGILLQNQFASAAAAAVMAVSQYFVFYSQIARPYIAGTFFSLLAILFWYKALTSKKINWQHLLGWTFFAAATCYVHHFALLLIGLTGITGLFLFRKEKLLTYFYSCIGIFLLYLPHLSIFITQLNNGGVEEWLAKPGPTFLLEFMHYFFQYSWIFGSVTVLAVLISLFSKSKRGKWFWPGLIWFGLSYLIGHIYSWQVNSVLQFSMLIFSVPFLLLSIFSLFPASNFRNNTLVSLAILLSGIYALKSERRHYEIFYESPYEYLVKDIVHYRDSLRLKEPALTDEHQKIFDYYTARYQLDQSDVLFWNDLEDFNQLTEHLKNKKEDYFKLAVMYQYPRELPMVVQDYFPSRILHKRYYQGDFFLFSRKRGSKLEESYWQSQSNDKKAGVEWGKEMADSLGWNNITQKQEYALGLSIPRVDSIYLHQHDIITYKASLHFSEKPSKNAICSALYSGDSIINFQSSYFSEYCGRKDSGLVNIYHSLTIPESFLNKDSLSMRIFIWNRDRQAFAVKEQELIIEKGNPELYALFQKLN